MKKPLRLVCGALAALFSAAMLAGCSVEDSSIASSGALSVASTGGYVEEDVSPDHNYNVGLFVVNIVLIDPLEQAIQFLIAGLQGFQLLLLQLSVGGLRLLGMADHSLHKLILKLAGKLSQPPDLA